MKRLLAIAVMLTASPVAAQGQSQTDGDAGAAYTRADAGMTAQWKLAYARMKERDAADTSHGRGSGYAPALLASQRAWLRFRDTECFLEGGAFASGMQGAATTRCKTRLSGERGVQLHELAARLR